MVLSKRTETQETSQPEVMTDAIAFANKAKEALAGLAGMYREQLDRDIPAMQDFLKKARKVTAEERYHLIRDEFFVKVHDMKGQGATFDYPLLTDLGQYTCDFLRNKSEVTVQDLDVLDKLMSDMEKVYQDRVTGLGGVFGEKIRVRLAQRAYEQ